MNQSKEQLLPNIESRHNSIIGFRDNSLDKDQNAQIVSATSSPKKFVSKHLQEYELQAKRYKEILQNSKTGSRNNTVVHPVTDVHTNV